MNRRFLGILLVLLLSALSAGCAGQNKKGEKLRDLEYTVVKEEEIPKELMTQIEEKREARFKLTYQQDGYLYIASGYGEQETGGYSIEMRELYVTENAVYFQTELIGPKKGDTVHHAPSYPYIVIKTEAVDEPVVFE